MGETAAQEHVWHKVAEADALPEGLAHNGPALVEIMTDAELV